MINTETEFGVSLIDFSIIEACTEREFKLFMRLATEYYLENLCKNNTIQRWTLQGIMDKDYGSLLCFLTDFAQAAYSTQRFPSHCTVAVISTTIINGANVKKAIKFAVTQEVSKPLGPGGSESGLGSTSSIRILNRNVRKQPRHETHGCFRRVDFHS